MKYFKNELWEAMNTGNFEEMKQAENIWYENSLEYSRKFEELRNRLSKKVFEHFNKWDFHDFRMLEYRISQAEYGKDIPVSVSINVTDDNEVWNIHYQKVSKIEIHYQCDDSTRFTKRKGFDDWGYHELLPFNDEIISHEILFASGATVLVHFPNKQIRITKLTKKN